MANEYLGKDIAYENNDIQFNNYNDFAIVKYEKNLKQAIYTRLNTFIGEYVNENYGSQLSLVLGYKRNSETLVLIKKFVQEALKQEPRIDIVNDINIKYDLDFNDKVIIEINVVPINDTNSINLIFPFFL